MMPRATRALALLAVLTSAPLAIAQTKSSEEPSYREWARQGAAYFSARDYENARQSFARAYELQPTPESLLNLAVAEVNSTRVVEGIAHLRKYLRAPGEPPPQAKAVREDILPKAYAKVGRVSVSLPDGTAIQLDERSEIVRAGDDETLVVMPGKHRLRAADGRTAEFTAEAGNQVAVTLPAPAPVVAPPAATAAERPYSARLSRTEPARPPTSSESATQSWDTRKLVLTIGAGVAVAALGAGAYFFAKESSDQEKVDARKQDLETKYGTPNSCRAGRVGAEDPWCSELKDLADTKVLSQNLATASFITAGVVGVSTIAGLLFWPSAGHQSGTGLMVTPIVGRDTVGVTLRTGY